MGAVGADAPIKIVLAKKYAVIVFCMNIYSAWHVDSAPMILNIFLRLCLMYGSSSSPFICPVELDQWYHIKELALAVQKGHQPHTTPTCLKSYGR